MASLTSDGTISDIVIGHAAAVLPDRVVDDARVVVRGGRITEVGTHPRGAECDLDARGAFVLPGLVDVHSDLLSREVRPRPGAALDPSFAVASAGARLRAAGITTAFHGLAFQESSIVGTPIDSPAASELSEALHDTDDSQVDHQVLHRLDIRCAHGRALLEKDFESRVSAPRVPVVSHEDHTPGQGQFSDPAKMQKWLVHGEGMSDEDAADHVEWWRSSRDERLAVRDSTLSWLEGLAQEGAIRLFAHDLTTPEEVSAAAARGCAVAEFPTTVSAARAARDLGMLIIAGTPNIVRGESHTGNVSAAELVSAGLTDALASDYIPTSMLPAILRLVRDGVAALPQAVRLVTSGAAACVGLDDRGSLVEGLRADLVLADFSKSWPSALAFTSRAMDDE
ncbi:alpha-D-ribose 1-methylphosphonate 5-triphosphate diphosphatase (plasmid) [Bacillus subtilis]|nr:alpha-D-ribose 1-methylphosphonate 5-triphosphate diphosphatase [Bacillus subtilis]